MERLVDELPFISDCPCQESVFSYRKTFRVFLSVSVLPLGEESVPIVNIHSDTVLYKLAAAAFLAELSFFSI